MSTGPRPHLRAVDVLTLGYVALAAGLSLARWPPGVGWPWLWLAFYALCAVWALLAPRLRARAGWAAFLGDFYPLLLTGGLYTAIGVVNRAAGLAWDPAVMAWEQALFGGQPSFDWIRTQPWPLLSWPLHVAYGSYYLILASSPLGLWLTGRRPAAQRAVRLIMSAFYACYLVFLLFPVAGPRYVLPAVENAASQVAPARLVHGLLELGSAWGTAFPSSHVAAGLAAAVAAWLGWRALGAVLVPLAVLMSIGTVYGQFHYGVDALAGVALAAALVALDLWRGRQGSAAPYNDGVSEANTIGGPRAGWPVRWHRLGDEPSEDLSPTTTAEERLAMMWPLALEAFGLAGPLPVYRRGEAPVALRRTRE